LAAVFLPFYLRVFFPPKFCLRSKILSSELGIDKLQLLLPVSEVSFRPDFPAIVDKPVNAATGEYIRDRTLYFAGDVPITGSKAFLNKDNFSLSIVPHRENDSSLVLVHFSGAAYSPDNSNPMDLEATFRASYGIKDELAALGCDFDMMKAKITRLDLARNTELSHEVSSYSPVFAAINCRKRVKKVEHGGTGFYAGNKQWETGFYDKGAEMHEKGIELAACPEKTLRAEMRYLKSATVRAAVGVETLADLKEKWLGFKPAYKQSLERDVFRAKPEENIERSIALHALADFIRESGVKRSADAFHKHLGMMTLVQMVGPEEATEYMALEFGYDHRTESGRKQVARLRAIYEQVSFSLQMDETTTRGTLVKELYRELRDSVLNF
jgi:hypothetical protein